MTFMGSDGRRPNSQEARPMSPSAQENRQAVISFLAAIPATALIMWATLGLASFVA